MEKKSNRLSIERDSETVSIWQEIARPNGLESPILAADAVYDVLIVGAGITGITTALLLQQAGKKCVVAEANTVGFGTTSGTSAHLNTFFDATYPEIESDFNEKAAAEVAKAGKEALLTIRELIKQYDIDCDFEYKKGYLFSENDKETEQLASILESSQKAGVLVEEVEENGIPIPFQHALKFANQAQFHPIAYVLKLAEEFKKLGGIILEQTFVLKTEFENDTHTATTDSQTIKAKHLVYATHIPPGINLFNFRCAPYRSYVLGIRLEDDSYPDCLSYDMQDPYHYFRSHIINGEKLLILGGEDHKTGHEYPVTAFENLATYARKYFKVKDILYQWSSQYYIPADGLPYIGQMPAGNDRTYIATGFNGNGMQFGTLSAKIITDLILGKENAYATLFNPSRIKPIAGFMDFVKENADVAYHFVADRFSAEEIDSLAALKPDEGKIVDFKDQKLAVYKSKTGKVSALNPVCTHAKCIVNFNDAEKSWDCPCHGGRFDINGKVLTGPPRADLEQINLKD